MAKQKKTKAAKPGKRKAAAKGRPRRGKGADLPRAPRNRPLPGMEHVRYADLDDLCETIADVRAKKNRLVGNEKNALVSALKALRGHGCTVYKHAGVELILVEGDAKVRVRLIADSEGEGADEADKGDGEDSGETYAGDGEGE